MLYDDTKNRAKDVDIAKGIAIICIILGHLENWSINRIVFTFHVPIFFFITGYFLNTKRNTMEFIKIKFRTLIMPYMITCIFMILLGTWKGQLVYADGISEMKRWLIASLYGAGGRLTTHLNIPGIGAIWFLLASFEGSCFLRILLKFNPYVRITGVVLLFCVGYFTRTHFWLPFSLQAGACATLFMYMGFLLKEMESTLLEIPYEVKCFGTLSVVLVWGGFIKNFQSFWLVQCDIGRGVIDIFGCVCACTSVIMVSKLIDRKAKYIRSFLAYFGRYSLFVLCIHILELNLFPWSRLVDMLISYGMPQSWRLMLYIIGKLALDLGCAYILSKIAFAKRLFGIKE